MEIINKKLHALLQEKDELVKQGRKLSAKVDITNLKIQKNEEKQRKYTNECEPKELIEKGNALAVVIEQNLTELENLQKEIHKLKIEAIPPAIAKEFEDLKVELDGYENARNKIALKVQKIKDRAVPIIQKEVKPYLEEFDDIDTAELKGEKIIVKTFNHLEKYKESFRAKSK